MATSGVDSQGAQGDVNAVRQQSMDDQVENVKAEAEFKKFTDMIKATEQLYR